MKKILFILGFVLIETLTVIFVGKGNYNSGLEKGYDKGYEEGYEEAYTKGYSLGYESCINAKAYTERPLTGWEQLQMAIIATESEYYSDVYNDVYCGILQIGPEYVDEVNRLIGKEIYKYEDAYDIAKSLKMFEIIQKVHNPEHDIEKTIDLHNPGCGMGYKNKVLSNMRLIARQEEVRAAILH